MVTRSEIISHIEARLSGMLNDEQLASWTFDQFYDMELHEAGLSPDDATIIPAILDTLMFMDDPAFALDEAILRDLITQLKYA